MKSTKAVAVHALPPSLDGLPTIRSPPGFQERVIGMVGASIVSSVSEMDVTSMTSVISDVLGDDRDSLGNALIAGGSGDLPDASN
jgi:hypothetical protein